MYIEIRTLRGGRGAVVIGRAGQARHGVDRVLEDVAGLRSDHFVLIAVAALLFPSGDVAERAHEVGDRASYSYLE